MVGEAWDQVCPLFRLSLSMSGISSPEFEKAGTEWILYFESSGDEFCRTPEGQGPVPWSEVQAVPTLGTTGRYHCLSLILLT